MGESRNARIVILGGGFGGLYTALELERVLARRNDLEVTLVNRENFFLFTPIYLSKLPRFEKTGGARLGPRPPVLERPGAAPNPALAESVGGGGRSSTNEDGLRQS